MALLYGFHRKSFADTFKIKYFPALEMHVNKYFVCRHLNKGIMEYGIPNEAPKPTPPKTKKSDLINPTTFTIADKIVDQV